MSNMNIVSRLYELYESTRVCVEIVHKKKKKKKKKNSSRFLGDVSFLDALTAEMTTSIIWRYNYLLEFQIGQFFGGETMIKYRNSLGFLVNLMI